MTAGRQGLCKLPLSDPDQAVIGRSLFGFIAGEGVQHLYELLLGRVRQTGRPADFPFRCDAPDRRRYMHMTVWPLEGGAIRFQNDLLREEPRDPVALLDPTAEHSPARVAICSWCKKVRTAADEWVEVEEAVARLGLFESAGLPGVTHGVCPACMALVQAQLGSDPRP